MKLTVLQFRKNKCINPKKQNIFNENLTKIYNIKGIYIKMPIYKCARCNKEFKQISHMKDHLNRKYKCNEIIVKNSYTLDKTENINEEIYFINENINEPINELLTENINEPITENINEHNNELLTEFLT